jgi:hypothetical protein
MSFGGRSGQRRGYPGPAPLTASRHVRRPPRSFQRLTLSWRIFGGDRLDAEIARIRAVLTSWSYKLGEEQDTLLPAVVSQAFLHVGSLSRSAISARSAQDT